MKPNRLIPILLLIALWSPLYAASQAEKAKAEDEREIKMGQEASAELEKQAKIVKDPVLQARLDGIGSEIATIAKTVEIRATYGSSRLSDFPYTFKIVDDKEINAFAVPGGTVYINKALVDFAHSEDELAGVLAHEIAHNAHHHMLALIREQSKLNNQIAIVLLATILGKMPGQQVGDIYMGAQLVQMAKMSSYGIKAETDADRTAIDYLARTNYSPVGLLTFLERLSATTQIYETPGVTQTHPFTGERRTALIARLNELKIPIARRKVSNSGKALLKTEKVDDEDIVSIVIDEKPLMRVADGPMGQPAAERAQQIADKVNDVLDSGVQLKDIKTKTDEPVVIARNKPFLGITDADAALNKQDASDLAASVAERLKNVIRKQMMDLAMIPLAKEKPGE